MMNIVKKELDTEWVKLIMKAKKIGLTPEEIRFYLTKMQNK